MPSNKVNKISYVDSTIIPHGRKFTFRVQNGSTSKGSVFFAENYFSYYFPVSKDKGLTEISIRHLGTCKINELFFPNMKTIARIPSSKISI